LREIRSGSVDVAQFRQNARAYAIRTFDRDVVWGPVADSLRAKQEQRLPGRSATE
jgi:hypothetical protein